jgi:ankyrin repeat protein
MKISWSLALKILMAIQLMSTSKKQREYTRAKGEERGVMVLIKAIERGEEERITHFITEGGLDPGGKTRRGVSPLQTAVLANSTTLIELLVRMGAKVEGTLLHLAAERSSQGVVEYLIQEKGLGVGERDEKGRSVLEAAATNNLNVFRYLNQPKNSFFINCLLILINNRCTGLTKGQVQSTLHGTFQFPNKKLSF